MDDSRDDGQDFDPTEQQRHEEANPLLRAAYRVGDACELAVRKRMVDKRIETLTDAIAELNEQRAKAILEQHGLHAQILILRNFS